MLATIITAAAAFAGTNIDDIFINALFFAGADTKAGTLSVVLGKYMGIGTLTLVSLICAFSLQAVPQKIIGFLGFVPIVLGIREWFSHRSRAASDNKTFAQTVGANKITAFSVMAVTAANGADNLAVYIPLFAAGTPAEIVCTVAVFAVMTAFWCILSQKLSRLPALHRFLNRHSHIIVPAVFILLGIYIFLKGFTTI